MIKYRIFQVIMAVAVVLLIISAAICLAFTVREVPESKYKVLSVMNETNASQEQESNSVTMTEFETWLEYSIIADGFDINNKNGFTQGSITLCEHNLYRLNQLRDIVGKARVTVFLSIILLVVGFLVVKKRRLYECIVWGGAASTVIGAASLVLLLVSNSGFFFGLKEMIFYDNYSDFFSNQDVLTGIIPDGLGLRMFLVYGGTIILGLVITIIVRLISWKKAQPHKF